MSHSTRAPQNVCISSVFGVADRIAAFAFTWSVNEYTKERPDSGARATIPNVQFDPGLGVVVLELGHGREEVERQ